MGGVFFSEVDRLQRMGVLIAVAGAAAVVCCVVRLLPSTGVRVAGRRRALCRLAGVAVLVFVPAGVAATSAEMQDVNSVSAMLLTCGIPWGVGLLAAGWLPRSAALASVLTVLGSILLGLIGPHMVDLVPGRSEPAFAAALLVGLLVLAVLAIPRPAAVRART